MIRISKLADYAVVVLVHLTGADGVQTCPAVAGATGVPEPTVAKVLKLLAAAGLVASRRGARGGYRLARPADAITIAAVISVMDGPIALTECADGRQECLQRHACPAHGGWNMVNGAIYDVFAGITIRDMQARAVPAARHAPPAGTRAGDHATRERHDAGGY